MVKFEKNEKIQILLKKGMEDRRNLNCFHPWRSKTKKFRYFKRWIILEEGKKLCTPSIEGRILMVR